MDSKGIASSGVACNIATSKGLELEQSAPVFSKVYEAYDSKGNLKWKEETHNLVVNQGKNDILDKYFKGSAYTASWFAGLKGTGTIAAGDTLDSHGGWAEITSYTGDRKAITWGTVSSQSLTATAVSFAITGTVTVAGGFICTVATGTSGILYSVENFSTSRSLENGDTLNVTCTVSMS